MSVATSYRCERCGRREQADRGWCGACGSIGSVRALAYFAGSVAEQARAIDERALTAHARRELSRLNAAELELRHVQTRHDDAAPAPARLRLVTLDVPETLPPPPPAPPSGALRLAGVPAETIDRVRANFGDLDRVLGGGVPLRRVWLLGGRKGTGKTTLSIRWAAGMAGSSGRDALLVSAEGESAPELARMAHDTGADVSRLVVLSERAAPLSRVLSEARQLRPVIVVLNSIQSLSVAGHRRGSDEHAEHVCGVLRDLSVELDCTVLAISQMTKTGELRGSNLLAQLCDTIGMLTIDDGGRRVLSVPEKNRGGPIGRLASYEWTEAGCLVPSEVSA